MKFEYPFNKLPEDYNKDNNSNHFQTCSPDNQSVHSSENKCLIASKENLSELSVKYKIGEQINCKQLPLIALKVNNTDELIEVLITDFRLSITNSKTKTLDERSKEFCPFVANIVNEENSWFAGNNKIWITIGVSIGGALIMFGFVFLYEKFVRDRFWYYLVNGQEDQENQS